MADLLNDLTQRTKAKYIVPLMSKADLNTLLKAINLKVDIADSFKYILTSVIGQDRCVNLFVQFTLLKLVGIIQNYKYKLCNNLHF